MLTTATSQKPKLRSVVAMLAVALLVVTNFTHIHVRYCMDGKEPPVSIHFETAELHAEEHTDDNDVENELSLDTLLSKVFDDSVDHALANSLILYTSSKTLVSTLPRASASLLNDGTYYLPPPRAPPARV